MADYEGPCKLPCPQQCDVPAGVTLSLVPVPRHAWGDVLVCPTEDCGRALLVVSREKFDQGKDGPTA